MIVVFLPEEIRQNRVYSHTALQFEPLYPGRMESLYDPRELPPAVTILENGDTLLRFYAPAAQEVCAGLMDQPLFPLTKGENGVWEGTLPFPGFGMVTIDWRVDGVQAVSYTHLDVYKRQVHNLPLNWLWPWRTHRHRFPPGPNHLQKQR